MGNTVRVVRVRYGRWKIDAEGDSIWRGDCLMERMGSEYLGKLVTKNWARLGGSIEICRKMFVENVWISLWDSLWERSGKVSHKEWKIMFSTGLVGKTQLFHAWVEKFYRAIYTGFNRGKNRVLHSFHRPYYYYYYLFI